MLYADARSLRKTVRETLQLLGLTGLPPRWLSVGTRVKDKGEYGISIRIRTPKRIPELEEEIPKLLPFLAPEDLDVQFTGPVFALGLIHGGTGAERLRIGDSVSHFETAGGTLGFFARSRLNGDIGLVSANHVIGKLGDATEGEAIVWPAGSKPETNKVARFVRSAPLAAGVETRVDGSFAKLNTNDFDPSTLPNGKLQPTIAADRESATVFKIGQGTNFTTGHVTSFDDDDFKVIGYRPGFGTVPFEDQIEVESTTKSHRFALGGDSGALVYNANFRAVGLAFAITAFGGKHHNGFTYVNPLSFVQDQLKVDLLA